MWYPLAAYLKFLLRSTNQHGVHSPFVYNLVTKCFYDKVKFEDYLKIRKYKKRLKKIKHIIEITDFGAGSRVTKSNKRAVSSIAKNSGTTLKRAKLLYRLVKYFDSNNILELGTSLGISTQAMSLGNPNAKITTIEGCHNISKFTKEQFENKGLRNIQIINSNFAKAIKNLDIAFDFVFFDGNHQKKATLSYFETLLPKAHKDTVFIFDDIYWSKGMTEAWETIKQHPKVTVTIDTFFWGFVFFRKEQEKEHFTIRV